jgi:NAD(P)-dependent dehydrogenase (short-subunit alcohol dehydrogenase family)
MARYFTPLLRHRERAVFASLSARVGSITDNRLGGWYAYRGAKAAQNMFTRNLSLEFRRRLKNVIVVALHPGTTDTGLSRPFQDNVSPEKLFPVDYAVACLLNIMDGLEPEQSGGFYAYDGSEIPW